MLAAAKPETAPISMVPSTPRLSTPARSESSSPSAASRIGVPETRAAASSSSMLIRAHRFGAEQA